MAPCEMCLLEGLVFESLSYLQQKMQHSTTQRSSGAAKLSCRAEEGLVA